VREAAVPSAAREALYFLISYPHTEYNGKGRERDPDDWVATFHGDLCRKVEELAAAPPGAHVGVLDRRLWVENDWLTGLPAALASCRVLVPLYSPRYFQSEACGREWYAFADRSASPSARRTYAPAIVPVMWSPMTPDSIPEEARSVPIEYGGVESYARLGLDGIIKLARYRPDYGQVVGWVARRIVATAKRFPAASCPVIDFDSLPNPFASGSVPEPGTPRLLITVAAPYRGNVPGGRDRRYYGAASWDWTPYLPVSAQPIAQYTANFARSLGYRPYIRDLGERADDLLIDGLPAHPELLIVDPWAVMRPECRHLLARFNLAAKPWVQVVIPWNSADQETTAAESRLWLALDSALRHKLDLGRVTCAAAVQGVRSIDGFGAVLPLLIPTAGKRYLGHAAAFPPDGSVVEKPTLHGFTPDPPDLMERAGA
jgi:FxsC-like protein